MKYVVYTDSDKEHLISFPRCINHKSMAEALDALRFGDDGRWHRRQGKVTSAGFIDGGECHGRSMTLNIGSRGVVDTALLKAGGDLAVTPKMPKPMK